MACSPLPPSCAHQVSPLLQLSCFGTALLLSGVSCLKPRSGVSVDDDEVDGVGDEIGDVNDNEVDGVGDKVGGINMSVQCVDLMLEVIPRPQWTTAFGSILIWTTNLLWVPSDIR
ncbi:hypothetical protein NDA11_004653 [Ustilago hordei]|uniref:Uncharacterized protein n=1 Tax=Ustilago hordei TaxID=120017 RepID=I2FSV3_USTHO|nr:hypothetical protein NDA10_002070 [Ustilago hordei]KAJ1570832.1 hypothetical protein NDA11_004653 [Ustilago hordei]KAJ1590490.1 hypothetical protein NDA12_007853 [Ustilago hordei]UTT96596.1 hypothetical protein NDA17_002888 [Ustilago hordei]CCF49996.1 uncharacterized protein UHOR_14135 [Ustilago hordei]